MSQTIRSDFDIDISGEVCPMTYVRTRLALERLQSGQILQVRLRGDEPARSVPESAIRQGHAVLLRHSEPDGSMRLLIRRK